MSTLKFNSNKLLGLVIGFILINFSIFCYSYIQKFEWLYLDLIILFILTFVTFYISTLFKIPFLKKNFWIGVTLSVFSSWIITDFRGFTKSAQRFDPKNYKTVPQLSTDQSLLGNDSIFLLKNIEIKEKFKGVDTFNYDNGAVIYFTFPLVNKDWDLKDSITYWACFKYRRIFFGKKIADYLKQIKSGNGYAIIIKNEIEKRKFADAVWKTVSENKLRKKDNFQLVEIVDYQMEYDFWDKRIKILLIITNVVWLLTLFFKLPDET